MAQWVKCLPLKCEVWGLDPQNAYKYLVGSGDLPVTLAHKGGDRRSPGKAVSLTVISGSVKDPTSVNKLESDGGRRRIATDILHVHAHTYTHTRACTHAYMCMYASMSTHTHMHIITGENTPSRLTLRPTSHGTQERRGCETGGV